MKIKKKNLQFNRLFYSESSILSTIEEKNYLAHFSFENFNKKPQLQSSTFKLRRWIIQKRFSHLFFFYFSNFNHFGRNSAVKLQIPFNRFQSCLSLHFHRSSFKSLSIRCRKTFITLEKFLMSLIVAAVIK